MPKHKLKQLLDAVRDTLWTGQHDLDIAIRAEVFAHRLSPKDAQQLTEAAQETNFYPRTEADLIQLLRKYNDEATEKSARRFCAYVEALSNCEANTTRDWIDVFVEGFTGFKTTTHVNDWLDNYSEAETEEITSFVGLARSFFTP